MGADVTVSGTLRVDPVDVDAEDLLPPVSLLKKLGLLVGIFTDLIEDPDEDNAVTLEVEAFRDVEGVGSRVPVGVG
jgi:hypothetical protein